MKARIYVAGILTGMMLSANYVQAEQCIPIASAEWNESAAMEKIKIQDLMELSGGTIEQLAEFCKANGLVLNQMKEGKLDYSFQINLYGSTSVVCVQVEENLVTEMYIKPGNVRFSGLVHQFNEMFGHCTEIEKMPSENQQMQYITWIAGSQSISIVKVNKNLYIYITPLD